MRSTCFIALVGLSTLFLVHCSTASDTPAANLPNSTSHANGGSADGDAGADARTPTLPPPPPPPAGCKDKNVGPHPKDDPCWVSDAFAVFVSSSKGNDTAGLGTQAAPLATLGRALAALKASPSLERTRVYLCAEDYVERTIEFVEGIAVYGYFDCTSLDPQGRWQVSKAARARIVSTMSTAAKAHNLVKSTRIDSLILQANDGAAPGGSSYGLIAENSSGLMFVASGIEAGKGANGQDGVAGKPLQNAPTSIGASNVRQGACHEFEMGGRESTVCDQLSFELEAAGGVNVCTGGPANLSSVVGGAGGKGGRSDSFQWTKQACGNRFQGYSDCFMPFEISNRVDQVDDSTHGYPDVASATTALGANAERVASSGAAGAAGGSGVNATTGTLTTQGFLPGAGTRGLNGAPGQGGGGGDSVAPVGIFLHYGDQFSGVTGAGGGAGGCPGLAGTPGIGGGASIGVLAIGSHISFDAATQIGASSGGRGGRGTPGSLAQPGARPGTNPTQEMHASGGAGGAGGVAGASGHGAAGPSYGLAWTGTKPLLLTIPQVAPAVPGNDPIANEDGVTVQAGSPGDSENVHPF